MTQVNARHGESFEGLYRRFKKAVEKSGILSDYKKNEVYEKPSIKKKKKSAAARKRVAKKESKTKGYKERNAGNKFNFKWNRDHTKKIPLKPFKPNAERPKYSKPNANRSFNKPRTKE